MSLDPDTIYNTIVQFGEGWADKKAAFEFLDDMTKTVLADLATDIKSAHKCSNTEAETRAYAQERYKAHLTSLATARREWLQAEVKYKSAQLLAELRRTEESTRRAEMNLR